MDKLVLSVVMFTDIVGYTHKMGDDRDLMLKLLGDHNEIIEGIVEKHGGKIIKRMGDAFMVNFTAAIDAVNSGLEIQKGFWVYNHGKQDKDQVHIRIGIHLSDNVIRPDDMFGEGVNIASRVESLSKQDGVCVTRPVYEIVMRKIGLNAISLGKHHLKNVRDPVELFLYLLETADNAEKKRPILSYILIAVVVLMSSVIMWQLELFQWNDTKSVSLQNDTTASIPVIIKPTISPQDTNSIVRDSMETVDLPLLSQTIRVLAACKTKSNLLQALSKYDQLGRIQVGSILDDVSGENRLLYAALFDDSLTEGFFYFDGQVYTDVNSGEVYKSLESNFTGKMVAWISEPVSK